MKIKDHEYYFSYILFSLSFRSQRSEVYNANLQHVFLIYNVCGTLLKREQIFRLHLESSPTTHLTALGASKWCFFFGGGEGGSEGKIREWEDMKFSRFHV